MSTGREPVSSSSSASGPILRRAARRFGLHEGGTAAVIFVLTLVPILALVGAAIDYARMAKAHAQLRDAVDAASLAAAKKIGGTYAQRRQAALGALQANLADAAIDSVHVSVTDTTSSDGRGVVVDASGDVPMSVMRVVGINVGQIGAKAEAIAGNVQQAEIALVLDNTGSMINDMPALKTAASNFVNTVFAGGSGAVKMSVVPYVAAVNVGTSFPPSALELTGTSALQGSFYRGGWLAYMDGCALLPSPAPAVVPPVGPPAPPPPPVGTPIGNDKTAGLSAPGAASDFAALTLGRSARDVAQRLFGVSRAVADVTAPTVDPIPTFAYTPSPPSYPAGLPTVQIPQGHYLYGCTLAHNGPVSNLELFNRIPGAAWKGCVEARVAPYDTTDDPPDPSVVGTMFAPYFAPDEPDTSSGPAFRNNYISDIHASWASNAGAPAGWNGIDRLHTLFKYDGFNLPTIVETAPVTKGPNANCPDPLLRLTNNKANILAKINSLNFWAGGGTISSEGLMWGWRTISPNAPFASGMAYGSSKKYIVLMTDGLNSLVQNMPNSSVSLYSDYTAYGFLKQGRLGANSFPVAEATLNATMLTACTNAKAKGIQIFTILFRETDPATVSLLQQCASSPEQALIAADTSSLYAAFDSVASQVAVIRLRR